MKKEAGGDDFPQELSDDQRMFAAYVTARVKPVERILRDSHSYHEGIFSVNPESQITPINKLIFRRYIVVETEYSHDDPKPDPYDVYVAEMKNDDLGISSSLTLTAHQGFMYVAESEAAPGSVSDGFALERMKSLIKLETAGHVRPIES